MQLTRRVLRFTIGGGGASGSGGRKYFEEIAPHFSTLVDSISVHISFGVEVYNGRPLPSEIEAIDGLHFGTLVLVLKRIGQFFAS